MFRKLSVVLVALLFGLPLAVVPAAAGDRFTDNGDGTVTDHRLGVMWARTDNQGDINWRQARQWVRYTFPFTIATSYDNWRLPTLEELQSLHAADPQYAGYETACGQTVKTVDAVRLTCGWVWSSETSAIQAKMFNFHRGYHYLDRMTQARGYRALPVRDLSPLPSAGGRAP